MAAVFRRFAAPWRERAPASKPQYESNPLGDRMTDVASTDQPGVPRQSRVASLSEARRALLQLQLREARETKAARERIQRVERSGPLPLSFAQQRLWFLD